MTGIAKGERVRVQCSVGPGAFLDEYLIIIETGEGQIAGFINADIVHEDDYGNNFVYALVQNVEGDKLALRLPGSFFTTTGIAYFPRKMVEAVA